MMRPPLTAAAWLLLALPVSAQEPPLPAPDVEEPPEAARSTTSGTTLLFREMDRAKALCGYREGEWRCDGLERWNVLITNETSAPSELEAKVEPVLVVKPEPCVRAIRLLVRHPTQRITVDWSGVALTVDGGARQVIPSFARAMTSSLAQKPSVAAAGTLLDEQIFMMDGECIVPIAPERERHTLTLSVPMRLDSADDVVDASSVLEWTTATERQAIDAVPVPVLGDEPSEPFWFPVATPVGLLVGALAGAGAGGFVYLSTHDAAAPFVCPIVCGSMIGVPVAGALGIVGLVVDGSTLAATGVASRERQAWFKAKVERDALLEKRRVLGLDEIEIAY